jgi:hypothetical protein
MRDELDLGRRRGDVMFQRYKYDPHTTLSKIPGRKGFGSDEDPDLGHPQAGRSGGRAELEAGGGLREKGAR